MDMKKICLNQADEALTHKWIKGEQLGYDPGDDAIHEWIRLHAKEYRQAYKDTYNATIQKVRQESSRRIADILGEIPEEDKMRLVEHICEKFTEIWVKEVATKDDRHIEEI